MDFQASFQQKNMRIEFIPPTAQKRATIDTKRDPSIPIGSEYWVPRKDCDTFYIIELQHVNHVKIDKLQVSKS